MIHKSALLTVKEMYEADRVTIAGGVLGRVLMENAGRASVEVILERYDPCNTVILCGPGNNGGDGFVIARLLQQAGWPVKVALLGDLNALKGDAALAARDWGEEADLRSISSVNASSIEDAELLVDAIFGAGLSREIDGVVAEIIDQANKEDIPVVAIDIPTGIDGDTGAIRGTAFVAETTITFFRKKPGHLLMPGKGVVGDVEVVEIGIDAAALSENKSALFENSPNLWGDRFPTPSIDTHKYKRGHTLVVGGGPWATGAARLAARGALRCGSGLVTLASPTDALAINAAHLTAIMLNPCDAANDLTALLQDERKNAVVVGPGCGVGTATREKVGAVLKMGCAAVVDADGLTSWSNNAEQLYELTHKNTVLTPHDGEFLRLFPDLANSDLPRIERVRKAAEISGAVTLLKGPDTIIGAPGGEIAITGNASRWLATAGSGDVLSGIIAGLMAQGMPAFDAACAGAWLHGEAGAHIGPGLIAEDVPEALPAILGQLMLMLAFQGTKPGDMGDDG